VLFPCIHEKNHVLMSFQCYLATTQPNRKVNFFFIILVLIWLTFLSKGSSSSAFEEHSGNANHQGNIYLNSSFFEAHLSHSMADHRQSLGATGTQRNFSTSDARHPKRFALLWTVRCPRLFTTTTTNCGASTAIQIVKAFIFLLEEGTARK